MKNEEIFGMCREPVLAEGLLITISPGAADCSAIQLAKRPENEGESIVEILPDTEERYLLTALYPFAKAL